MKKTSINKADTNKANTTGNEIKKKYTGIIKNVITVLFLVIAVVFLIKTVKSNFLQIRSMDFTVNWWVFGLSMVIYFI